MDVRQLEIRIIKASDLKDVNLMTKMDVFALVSISGDQLNNPQQKTDVDKDGGTSPKWNFHTQFTVDDAAVQENRVTLKIKLISNRSLGNKEIGVVYVQIKEMFDGGGAGEEEKSGSYSVRLSNGTVKGNLDLAYKFGEKYKIERPPSPPPPPPPMEEPRNMNGVDSPQVMAYPSTFPDVSSTYSPPAEAYRPPHGGYPNPLPPGAYPPPHVGYRYGSYQPPPPGYGYPPMQRL